jgi:hypothetical protein
VLTLLALTWLNPHVYLDTVVLLGTMASPYPTWGRAAFATGGALASALWFTAIGFGARWLAPLFASPGVAGAGWGHCGLHDGLGICDGSKLRTISSLHARCDLVHSAVID